MRAKIIKIPTYDELYEQAPEVIKMIIDESKNTLQSKNWHPEGPVDIHMRIVYNRARKSGDLNMAIAAFFHDLGKVETTKFIKGKWSAHGHEFVSARLVDRYRIWIESLGASYEVVHYIVANHMKVKHFHEMRPTKREIFQKQKYFPLANAFSKFDDMQTDYSNDIND